MSAEYEQSPDTPDPAIHPNNFINPASIAKYIPLLVDRKSNTKYDPNSRFNFNDIRIYPLPIDKKPMGIDNLIDIDKPANIAKLVNLADTLLVKENLHAEFIRRATWNEEWAEKSNPTGLDYLMGDFNEQEESFYSYVRVRLAEYVTFLVCWVYDGKRLEHQKEVGYSGLDIPEEKSKEYSIRVLDRLLGDSLNLDSKQILLWSQKQFANLLLQSIEKDWSFDNFASMDQDHQWRLYCAYYADGALPNDTLDILSILNAYIEGIQSWINKSFSIKDMSLLELEALLGKDFIEDRYTPLNLAPSEAIADNATQQPVTLPLFVNKEITEIASASPVRVGLLSVLCRDQWRDNANEQPTFDYSSKKGVVTIFITEEDKGKEIEVAAGKAAWDIINRFSLRVAMLHMLFAAYTMEIPQPWENGCKIKATHVLSSNILDTDKKRSDQTKSQNLRELIEELEILQRLGIYIKRWMEGKKDLSLETSLLWNLDFVVYGRPLSSDLITEHSSFARDLDNMEITEVIIDFKPGRWTKKFLNEKGAEEGIRQFSWLAKRTLQDFNLKREPMAIKAALYLTIESRITAKDGYKYKISNLLEKLLPANELAEAHHNPQKRYEIKQQWDNAILSLDEKAWQIEYPENTYPQYLWPDWYLLRKLNIESIDDIEPRTRLPKNYWDALLSAMIIIRPADPIPAELKKANKKLPYRKMNELPTVYGGPEVKLLRNKRGLTQKELVFRVGKSEAWLSHIENGTRSLSIEDYKQLKNLLEPEIKH